MRFLRKFWSNHVRSSVHDDERSFVKLLNLKKGDEPDEGTESLDAILRGLQRRSSGDQPEFPRQYVDVAMCSTESLLRAADGLLQQRFVLSAEPEVHFPASIDWSYDPTPDPRRRWCREMHRHRWAATLAEAYQRSGDEHYAGKLIELLTDWIGHNPPPAEKDESHVVWTLMGAGMRASIWPAVFFLLLPSPAFDRKAKILLLQSLHDHGEFLYRFKTHANHLLREINGLLALAGHFPEFRAAPSWKARALERLADEIARQVYPDGCHQEMSSAYQWMVIEELEAAERLLNNFNWALPHGDLLVTLNRLYDVLVHTARPDGSWPQLGDGFMEPPETLRDRMRNAASRLQRSDLLFVAEQGCNGARPTHKAKCLPYGGLATMRSDWSSDANYLLMKAGPFGGAHGHEDKLSIEICARGQMLLVDPGTYTYQASDPFRTYFVSSNSHNTVLVDGMSQARRWSARHRAPAGHTGERVDFVTGDRFVFAAGQYNEGYAGYQFMVPRHPKTLSEVCHTRQILFVDGAYWLIRDQMIADRSHTYTRVFQACNGAQIRQHPQGVVVQSADSGTLLYLVNPVDDALTVQCVSGEDPSHKGGGGWVCNGTRNHKEPAPRVSFEQQANGPTDLFTLLVPVPAGEAPQIPQLQRQTLSQGSGWAVSIDNHQEQDLIIVSDNTKEKRVGEIATWATIAGFRRDGADSEWQVLFENTGSIGPET